MTDMNEDKKKELEFFFYAQEQEKQWKESFVRLSDKELFIIFPEAKKIIPLKVREWKKEYIKVWLYIKNKWKDIYQKIDKKDLWFWQIVIKQYDITKLKEINKHIFRLQRQLNLIQNKKPKSTMITQEQIEQALTFPLVNIATNKMNLRKTGSTSVGLCPFHKENSPSFHIYHSTNSYYCYGCQKGGNAINFVRDLEGLTFKEAINYLT